MHFRTLLEHKVASVNKSSDPDIMFAKNEIARKGMTAVILKINVIL